MDLQLALPAPKRPRLKDKFARLAGAATGITTGLILPHAFCLGPVIIGAIGAGASNNAASTISYTIGAGVLAAGTYVGIRALRPSTKPCCIAFGETPKERFKKAALMVVPGLIIAAGINTYMGRGLSDPAISPDIIRWSLNSGISPITLLKDLCLTR